MRESPVDELGGAAPGGAARPPVSGAVICRDEERHIGACLRSLAWCDEVVVLDSGSVDRTLEIAASFPNVRIERHDFDGYVTQVNRVLDLCRNDWVFVLDADEELEPGLVEEIAALDFAGEGYRMRRRNFVGEREVRFGAWSPDWKVRLFRRSRGRFAGDEPHYTLRLASRPRALRGRILHRSYESLDEYVERSRRYARLVAEDRRRRGCRSGPLRPWLHGAWSLFKSALLKAGFLDGLTGLRLAWHGARASFLKYRWLR